MEEKSISFTSYSVKTLSKADKMKILHIHSQYREYRKTLFTELSKNFDIEYLFIVRPKQNENIPDSLKMKYRCLGLWDKKIPGLGIKGCFLLFFRLLKEILNSKCDIVFTATEHPLHSKIAFLGSKILNKKFMVLTESWHDNPNHSAFTKVYHYFARMILRKSDAVLVHGTNQKKYCLELGIPEDKIFVFNHCSNDISKNTITEGMRKTLSIDRDKKIVLAIGRLLKTKGFDILLKAFKKIETEYGDKVYLIICGEGEQKRYLRSLINELNIKNCVLYGFISSKEVQNFYCIADIFVLPSYGEGWGLVINEAASMGLSIVTTDGVGAAPDLVKDGYNGYVIEKGNAEELYVALKGILSDEELRRKMGKNSRKVFEEFNNYEKVVNNLKNALEFVKNKKFGA